MCVRLTQPRRFIAKSHGRRLLLCVQHWSELPDPNPPRGRLVRDPSTCWLISFFAQALQMHGLHLRRRPGRTVPWQLRECFDQRRWAYGNSRDFEDGESGIADQMDWTNNARRRPASRRPRAREAASGNAHSVASGPERVMRSPAGSRRRVSPMVASELFLKFPIFASGQ
jgi:hypothetical protein